MFKIEIWFDEETYTFKVEAPVAHDVLCYGMLEKARGLIKDAYDKKNKGKKPAIELVDATALAALGLKPPH